MSFDTYKADQYKKYLNEYLTTLEYIYKFITASELPKTTIAKKCGMTYQKYSRHLALQNFTTAQISSILDAIK